MRFKFLPLIAFMLFTVWSFGVTPQYALAVSPSAISVDMAPENPSPNEDVTVLISSFAVNLESVNIAWYVNGKIASSGIGKKTFSVKAGDAGSETRLDIKIALPDGDMTKTVTVRPAVIVMLWQANDSFVPPFYKGKALLSEGSEVKVVAMPEIKSGKTLVNPKNMTYSWKKDYTNDPNGSGYGKNYFTYVDDYLETTSNVSVIASTLSQKYSSAGSITTQTTKPEIHFYKKDPSFGIMWDSTLTDGHVVEGSETLVAMPYFISPKQLSVPTLLFNWYINGQKIDVKNYFKNFLPLTVENGATGSSDVSLYIESTELIFETASKSLHLGF